MTMGVGEEADSKDIEDGVLAGADGKDECAGVRDKEAIRMTPRFLAW